MFNDAIFSVGILAALFIAGVIPYYLFSVFYRWIDSHRRRAQDTRESIEETIDDLEMYGGNEESIQNVVHALRCIARDCK